MQNSYTAYCNYVIVILFHPYKLCFFHTVWRYVDVGKPPEKKKKKTEEEKEDEAHAKGYCYVANKSI